MVRQRENVLEGEALGGEPSSIRGAAALRWQGSKKAGQAGLSGLGWRKGVVRLLRLEKRFKLEAGKEYGV